MPLDVALRPVSSDDRVGEHRAVVWKFPNRTPSSAIRRMVGVSTGPPKHVHRAVADVVPGDEQDVRGALGRLRCEEGSQSGIESRMSRAIFPLNFRVISTPHSPHRWCLAEERRSRPGRVPSLAVAEPVCRLQAVMGKRDRGVHRHLGPSAELGSWSPGQGKAGGPLRQVGAGGKGAESLWCRPIHAHSVPHRDAERYRASPKGLERRIGVARHRRLGGRRSVYPDRWRSGDHSFAVMDSELAAPARQWPGGAIDARGWACSR